MGNEHMTNRKITDTIIVHCAATKPSQKVTVADITAWHKARGFDTIGYHFVINRCGSIAKGRDELAVGAHAKGHNSTSIGICLVGGLNEAGKADANFTKAQYDSLQFLHKTLCEKYPSIVKVIGHRDVDSGKECPCFDVASFFSEV